MIAVTIVVIRYVRCSVKQRSMLRTVWRRPTTTRSQRFGNESDSRNASLSSTPTVRLQFSTKGTRDHEKRASPFRELAIHQGPSGYDHRHHGANGSPGRRTRCRKPEREMSSVVGDRQ